MVHELDLIQTFIRESLQQRDLILSSPVLKAHHVCGLNQLIGREQGVIMAVALEQTPLTVLVKSGSCYRNLIHQILAEEHFLLVGVGSSAAPQSFLSYRQVCPPKGYRFNCTLPKVLWRAWWHHRQQLQHSGLLTDLLIWVGHQWYPVRSLLIQEGRIHVKSLLREVVLSSQESIVWLEKIQMQQEQIMDEGRNLPAIEPLHSREANLRILTDHYAVAV